MNHFHKLLLALSLAILLPFSVTRAQNDVTPNSLHSGSKALMFQISEDFFLHPYSGTAISYKWQLSEERAKRIGLSLGNWYHRRSIPDSEDEVLSDLNLDVGFIYTWMNYYTNPGSEISFYYGYGPGIDFGYGKSKRDDNNRTRTSLMTTYGISANGYTGVEWFFKSSMSLHAEYRLSIQARHRLEKRVTDVYDIIGNQDSTRITTTTLSFGGSGIRLGLSVYF